MKDRNEHLILQDINKQESRSKTIAEIFDNDIQIIWKRKELHHYEITL